MKVGDLVKWMYPEALDYGLIIKLGSGVFTGQAYIEWMNEPDHSGYYPLGHELLEVIK